MNFTDLKTVCQYLQSQKNCKFTSGHCGETLRVTVLSIVFSVIRIIFSSGSSVVDHCEVVDQVCRDTWKLSITFQNHFILVDQILWISRSPSPQKRKQQKHMFLVVGVYKCFVWLKTFRQVFLFFQNKSSSKTFFKCFCLYNTQICFPCFGKYLKLPCFGKYSKLRKCMFTRGIDSTGERSLNINPKQNLLILANV